MNFKAIICDDESIIRQGVGKMLTTAYDCIETVAECENGQEAYKAVLSCSPHLVITDIRMPVMGGLELCARCSLLPNPPRFIIISAYSEFEYARTALKYGVAEYLLKPINRFELEDAVGRALGIQARRAARPQLSPEEGDQGVVGKAKSYIEKNFYRSISLEEMSQSVGANPNYLSSLFKKQTGMKYIDYLTRLRMEKAHNLLLNTDLKIGDISEMVGYLSTKHFTRVYREHFAETPSETREKK